MMTDQSNPWVTLSTQHFYDSRYVGVEEDQVRHRSGRVHPYTALRFRIVGIAVLPILSDGSTLLVGQYRYLSQCYTWELPRGSGPKTEPALATAQRELEEETGLAEGQWLQLSNLMVSPGISDERAPCFVAWDLEQKAAHPDPQEDLTLRRLAFQDAVDAALDGTIQDAVSIATLLTVQSRAARKDLPDGLMRLLAL
ncbi:NUDIX domain-containing protein [Microvirga sp. P5_D2]